MKFRAHRGQRALGAEVRGQSATSIAETDHPRRKLTVFAVRERLPAFLGTCFEMF